MTYVLDDNIYASEKTGFYRRTTEINLCRISLLALAMVRYALIPLSFEHCHDCNAHVKCKIAAMAFHKDTVNKTNIITVTEEAVKLAKTVFNSDAGFTFEAFLAGNEFNLMLAVTDNGRAMTDLLTSELQLKAGETYESVWSQALCKNWVMFQFSGRRESDFVHSKAVHYREDHAGKLVPCEDCRACDDYYFSEPRDDDWNTDRSPLKLLRERLEALQSLDAFPTFSGTWSNSSIEGVNGSQGIIVVEEHEKITAI